MMNTLSTMSIFVTILLLSIARVQMVSVIDCGPNEIKVNCGPLLSCQPSCSEPNGTACPRLCAINACICKEGFVRDNHHNSQCIEPNQCIQPKIVRPSPCGPNEVESQCALLPGCQPSCDEPNRQPCPTFRCSEGCVCSRNYLRATNETTSPCIRCKHFID